MAWDNLYPDRERVFIAIYGYTFKNKYIYLAKLHHSHSFVFPSVHNDNGTSNYTIKELAVLRKLIHVHVRGLQILSKEKLFYSTSASPVLCIPLHKAVASKLTTTNHYDWQLNRMSVQIINEVYTLNLVLTSPSSQCSSICLPLVYPKQCQ